MQLDGEPTTGEPRPGRLLLVDAANVVGSRPNGWWRDRPAAARSLVNRLRRGVADGNLDSPVVVVLEGAGRSGMVEGDSGGVRVVHAVSSGDDRLVEIATGATPMPVVVVTADRLLRARVAAIGARAVGPAWLHHRLDGHDLTGDRT